jgi:hydroxyacyl-ACP dehydratase HTD2-like protein with hotdog domain
VSLKGFDGANPMIFVNQRMEFTHPDAEPQKPAGVVEERRHVYMLPQKESSSGGGGRAPRPVKDIPARSDFSFHYTPTPIHLFRFSALIFNAHYIHLDRVYAKQAGYPDLLVHGPLTALMLLEAFKTRNRGVQLKSFEYRAHNPMLVDQRVTVHGVMNSTSNAMGSGATESGTKMARLWCETDDGIIGMSAWVEYY